MKKGIFLFALCCFYFAGKASPHQLFSKAAWRVSISNHAISMPTRPVNGQWQPGLELSYIARIKNSEKTQALYNQFAIGYFAHRSLQRVSYLKYGIGYTWILNAKWFLRPSLNLSTLGVWNSNEEFTYSGSGQYQKHSPFSVQAMPSIGLESVFLFANKGAYRWGWLLRYEFGVQGPFSILSSILPVNQFYTGIQLKKNK